MIRCGKNYLLLVMENHVDVILGFVLEENGKLWNAAACLCEMVLDITIGRVI